MKHLTLLLTTVFTLSALAACGGGGGGAGIALPLADNVLPSEVPDGSVDGIEDYLVPGSGTWQVNLDGQIQTVAFGSAVMADALIYDADLDQWTVNIRGRNLVLSNDGTGFYFTGCAADSANCVLFLTYDDNPSTSQYGTFGYIFYADSRRLVEYFAHAGLKTQLADMPASGTGNYNGTLYGLVNSTIGFDYVEGSVDVTASFVSGGGNLSFGSSGAGDYGTYSLTGSAVISGNTYDGTVSGSYTNSIATTSFSASGSTLSGAFYGPDANETAGVVYTSSASDNDPFWGEFAGGFWATQ